MHGGKRAGARSLPAQFVSLWQIMQGVELCRHRAEIAERRAETGSVTFRTEMAEVAANWRHLAAAIEQMASTIDPTRREPSRPEDRRPAADDGT